LIQRRSRASHHTLPPSVSTVTDRYRLASVGSASE